MFTEREVLTRSGDEYLVLADYRSYIVAQEEAGKAYADREGWTATSIRGVARMGAFFQT